MRFLLPIALTACVADRGGEDSAAPPLVPSAWSWEESVERGPPLSAAEVEAALPALLGELADFHGLGVVELYRSRMELREPPCPYIERTTQTQPDYVLSEYWNGDECTSASGVYFDGYAYSRESFDRDLGDGLVYDGFDFKGDGVVIEPDGATFIVGGFAFVWEGVSRDGQEQGWQTGVQGSVTWTGEGYDSAWFTGDRVAEMIVEAHDLRRGRDFRAEGGVAGFEGSLQGLVAWPVAAYEDSACPQELGGELWLRDESGRWYYLQFDGATSPEDAVDMSACDGCGRLSLDGEALGEVCVSPDRLWAWEGSPW